MKTVARLFVALLALMAASRLSRVAFVWRVLSVLSATRLWARLATTYENAALQAILPYSGVAGTVANCTSANTSYVLTTSNSFGTLPIVQGMGYTGANLTAGTVLLVVSNTVLIMSAAATGNISGTATFTVTPQYLSLHTADPGTTGASEATGGSYARQSIAWGVIASGANASNTGQNFTSMPSITSAYFGVWTAVSSGSYIAGGALGSSLTIPTGSTVSFAIGAVTGGET